MQELTYLGPGRVEWRESAPPTLRADCEAIIEPIAVATCDLDVAMLQGQFTMFEGPFPIGHEGVGRVVDVGDTVTTVSPGDVVIIPFQISCGACPTCTRGRTANCTSVPNGSMYGLRPFGGDWGGFLSDRFRVPFADSMLVGLPEGIDPLAVASCSDNLPDAWRAVAPALQQHPGDDVLIVGGGANSVPLYATAIALALGAGHVDYLDSDPTRLEIAGSLGARTAPGPAPHRFGTYPITVDASGSERGLGCALRSIAPDGTCTSVSIYQEAIAIPLFEMYTKGVTFRTGRTHARPPIPDLLGLIADGGLHPELVTSAVVGWNEACTALADPPIKLVITK